MSVFYLIPGSSKPQTSENSSTSGEKDSQTCRSDIWFEDGNIILQAGHTQFRVHRGIIELHSRVFKGMFPIPRPEGELLVDGCPLIHVFDDPEDWRNLFDVMYNSRKAFKSENGPFPIKVLVAMLRLGQKYEFEDFRDDALERLKAAFATTLDGYDALLDTEADDGQVSTEGNEFDLLNIALELRIHTILPMAYLICIRDTTTEAIFEGQKREDGSIATLSTISQSVIVLGRRDLVNAVTARACGWLKADVIPSGKCASQLACAQTRIKVLERLCFHGIHLSLDPQMDSLSSDAEKLCERCYSVAQASYEAGREEIWTELPSYFMLPAWKDLKDFEL